MTAQPNPPRGRRAGWQPRPVSGDHPTVVIADDHPVTRQGLRLLLAQHGFDVVDTVANGREAVLSTWNNRPEIILMDLVMPSLNGIEATQQIKRDYPETRIVILSGLTDEEHIVNALRAGADGYLSKGCEVAELIAAVQAIYRGRTYISSDLRERYDVVSLLEQASTEGPRTGLARLTAREREVLQLIGEGKTNLVIADELGISIKTVEAHRARIKSKLGSKSRADLVRMAVQAGLMNRATS
jgi:DNA-binding NarL/FixJ family response regulator